MPIDTAVKRGSAIDVSMPWRPFLPLPDGAINQGDRQAVPFMYSGILAGGTPSVATRPFDHPLIVTMGKLLSR